MGLWAPGPNAMWRRLVENPRLVYKHGVETRQEKIMRYEQYSAQNLIRANDLSEKGRTAEAEEFYNKSARWLMKANDLRESNPRLVYMDKPPAKTVTAYKQYIVRDGQLYPLFIGAKEPQPIGPWLEGEYLPTKGFSDEHPGYHAGLLPRAPQLRSNPRQPELRQIQPDRVWCEVEMPADVDWQSVASASKGKMVPGKQLPLGGNYDWDKGKGGIWKVAGGVRIVRVLSNPEVAGVLRKAGVPEEEISREQGPAADAWAEKINNAARNAVIRQVAGRRPQ